MDKATADKGDLKVGDKLLLAGRGPARTYKIAGITKIGDQSSLGHRQR